MEKAGAEDMPDDAERKGIGTPATRAATIERLLQVKYLERKGKSLLSTEKGQNLIKVLPENDPVKQPKLTGEWESDLKDVEKGNITAESFMQSISKYVTDAVKQNSTPTEEGLKLFPPKYASGGSTSVKTIGDKICDCPRCGGDVFEKDKAYGCINKDCNYALYKESKFLTSAKKKLTPAIAKTLLKDGKILIKGLYSKTKDKTYDAYLVLEDKGSGWLNIKPDFSKKVT